MEPAKGGAAALAFGLNSGWWQQMRRKAEFLLVLGALLSLAGCARTPSRVSREITAAGSRSELVEATIEAIGYEGWPYETNTTFRDRHQLDTLYDILRESQPEGQWAASDQANRLILTFRSGKVVSLQFGAEESVRALYGTPLMEFFRRVAVPTVLKNGWVPNQEVRAKVRDVSPDNVEKLTINGREFDGPLESRTTPADLTSGWPHRSVNRCWGHRVRSYSVLC